VRQHLLRRTQAQPALHGREQSLVADYLAAQGAAPSSPRCGAARSVGADDPSAHDA
jgi:hypothetical protein